MALDDAGSTLTLRAGAPLSVTAGAGNDAFVAGTAHSRLPIRSTAAAVPTRSPLNGDFSAGIVFRATTLAGVEQITVATGNDYRLTTNDATVAVGRTLTVDGSGRGSGDTSNFNGAAETDGQFVLIGGAGNDTFTAGSGADALTGGGEYDVLKGGGGSDTLDGAGGNDALDGGAGVDTADYRDRMAAVEVTLNGGELRHRFGGRRCRGYRPQYRERLRRLRRRHVERRRLCQRARRRPSR